MIEDEARQWIGDRFGPAALDRLTVLAGLVTAEAARQNLVAASTLDALWTRHIVDSAQLVPLAGATQGLWIDIGTGAGFPGLVVATLMDAEFMLVEPRRRRVEFLEHAVEALELTERVTVHKGKVDGIETEAAVISARAVSRIGALFASAARCATKGTLWLLPKGKNAREEVAEAKRSWHGTFHVEQSITDPESQIVTATRVSRR